MGGEELEDEGEELDESGEEDEEIGGLSGIFGVLSFFLFFRTNIKIILTTAITTTIPVIIMIFFTKEDF